MYTEVTAQKMNDTNYEFAGRSVDGTGSTEVPAVNGVSMVLWTRRPVCGPRTDVIDRLSRLDSNGDVAAFDIQTWPGKVVLDEHTEHATVVERFEAFRSWADDRGVTVMPPFERRAVTSLVGQKREVLTVPMMCLAVYEDGDLRGVYPCSDGDRTWRVTDALDSYEAGKAPTPASVETDERPATASGAADDDS